MLFLRVILLWSLLSIHIIGGATLFRRLHPRESPWLGFFVPSLGLVLLLNFVEHGIALPSLLWLLPLTTLVCIWGIVGPRTRWQGLVLPSAIFLISFAFALGLRCLKPDITSTRDGVYDLSLIADFCAGQKLPPTCSWMPPFELKYYYALVQYAASVLIRLFHVDIGTGFNLTTALLSAITCVVAAAIAWRVSRQKLWITILTPVLIECAATGSSAYLWLTTKNVDATVSQNLFAGMDNQADHNPLWRVLQPTDIYDRRELMVPGSWSWAGSCHATVGGQFLVLLSVFALFEVVRRKPSNWPWICLASVPVFMCVTSTWGMPFVGLLLFVGLGWAAYYKLYPQSWRFALMAFAVVVMLLTPILSDFLTTQTMPPGLPTEPGEHTQLVEFFIQWWPVFLPWIALFFVWRRLHPVTKTLLFALPAVGCLWSTIRSAYASI